MIKYIVKVETLNNKTREICQIVYFTPVSQKIHSRESIGVGGLLIVNRNVLSILQGWGSIDCTIVYTTSWTIVCNLSCTKSCTIVVTLCSRDFTSNFNDSLYKSNCNFNSYKFSNKFAFFPFLLLRT